MKLRIVLVGLILGTASFAWAAAGPRTLYVAPDGSDKWSGRLPTANAAKTDGPLATPLAARDAVRRLRAAGEKGPVTVRLRGGTYWMTEPFVLEPQDSGTADGPTVYAAHESERPVLSGGRVIRGWQARVGGPWSTTIPEVAAGQWSFQQLWVGGQRRRRARSPNEDYYRMVQKAPPAADAAGKPVPRDRTAFLFAADNIKPWPDLKEAQVVVFHSWETSRLRIAGVDESQRLVTFTGPSCWPFENWEKKQRYYVENVREALDAPGEWYLDRSTGTLYYYPMPGEDMAKAEVIAPRLTRLVDLRGRPDESQFVQYVTFRGIAFSHEDWTLEPQGHSDSQAVVTAPAAVMADGARHCVIEKCEISHVGDYGVWLRRGCKDCRIVENRIRDLGVGGVRIGEAQLPATDEAESSDNTVDNNHIFDGGHVYPAGVGVWVGQSSRNTISHNEIHDFSYSGMSIGWNWDDAPNRCHHNTIELNHVHHVMKGMLSDGGAIYTLGVSTGSVIRNNVFHDVWSYANPPFGWGIYLDATTGGYLVENNVVYNIHAGCLMYSNGGHEHVIRNNIFAFPANYMLWPFWEKRPTAFQHNLMIMTQGTLFVPFTERTLRERLAAKESSGPWDENLYWHTAEREGLKFFKTSFAEWQALGLDRKSLVADPRFVNAAEYDFRLQPGSPALGLGFQPIDTSRVGLYGDPAWVEEGRRVKHPKTVFPPPPPPPQPREVAEDFEKCELGASPELAMVSGEQQGASIRVTDEQAASGKRSLKVKDTKGLEPSWQPHFFYQPHIVEGTVRQSFDLKLQPGALLFTEWRDETTYPACVGPSVTFDSSGRITAGGKLLTTVPIDGWIHVEIEAALGKGASGKFTLTLVPRGGARQVFADLPMPGSAFRELHWLGFVSTAAADTAFFVDNLEIKRKVVNP
ncbi:MAG: right-handed parallel beta-helix repeat-containing protein [Planctomycetota bacterium]